MDALKLQTTAFVLFLGLIASSARSAETYQTINFSVKASSAATAEEVGKAAENYRRQLAIFWLGKPLPNWSAPCKIVVKEGQIGAGGRTTFQFVRGEVLNWSMEVQGTKERILDSVLPHEVNHTIFACHFRRPLPRWADEGAATLFEHRSEQIKQLGLLNQVIRSRTAMITLRELLSMKNYPEDHRRMLTLYAQGYALADFLVQQKGRHAYLKFISDGERIGWEEAIKANFDHDGIESLEKNWKGWILAGMPKLTLPREQMLAATSKPAESEVVETAKSEVAETAKPNASVSKDSRLVSKLRRNAVVRSQSPDSNRETDSNAARTPANSDEAMPSQFLEADKLQENGSMGTRIEAPLPKKMLGMTRAVRDVAEDAGKPVDASTKSATRNQGDSKPANKVELFEEWMSRSAESPSSESFEPDADSKSVRPQLRPTSLVEESDSEKQRQFDFSQPTRQTPANATGSKPAWASFPGAE